jgi:arylsulfate sulfotransferase
MVFLSGPTFTPATAAPLAGLLQVTTDVRARISVTVNDGTNVWKRDFYSFAASNSIPLLGFGPARTNQIQVTAYDQIGNSVTASQILTFVTAPLPTNFPVFTVLQSQPNKMEPGYRFFMVRNGDVNIGYIVIMDNNGNVVWYSKCPNLYDLNVQPISDGNIFIPGEENRFSEINMLGQTVQTWTPPAGHPINPHDGYPTDHGTILYMSDSSRLVANMPTSDTISNPPTSSENVDDNPAVEISITNSALLNSWSPLNVLEPTRVTYLTYGTGSGSPYGVDNEHGNAVYEDTNDASLIISLRNQNAVIKVDRATGNLKWILGPPADWGAAWQPFLLTPVGAPFDWNYGQHAPKLTPDGTLILYDDNNYDASPFATSVADQNNQSSAIEYSIDETNMQVSEVWNSSWQTNQDRLFTPYVGMVSWGPQTRNVLVTYGAVSYVNGAHPSAYSTNANMVRLIEYTHDAVPEIVSDVRFFDTSRTNSNYQGYFCYRAYLVADLYAHPALQVADLRVIEIGGTSVLQFSGDPTHSYQVQASADLANWNDLGPATQDDVTGLFEFEDADQGDYPNRFYRVVTQ